MRHMELLSLILPDPLCSAQPALSLFCYRLLWVDGVAWCESKALSNRHTFVCVCAYVCVCVSVFFQSFWRVCMDRYGDDLLWEQINDVTWSITHTHIPGVSFALDWLRILGKPLFVCFFSLTNNTELY